MRGFASDNNAGVHPELLDAIVRANAGHTVGYGDDRYTASAVSTFRNLLGQDTEVFFVFNGTAGNVLGLQAVTRSFHAVICTEMAHLNVDECGAPEKFTGCKLLTVPTENGKLTCTDIEVHLHRVGFEHHVQPRVVSITQATEVGTVYTIKEIQTLAQFAHDHDLLLHVDGARLSNAAVFLACSLRDMTRDAGVDILTFGGTKNGMMFGEAVVFFDPKFAQEFKYLRKQGMQLGSKMRFVSVQFDALLKDGLWKRNAEHANRMTRLLEEGISGIEGIGITQPVQTNGVFAKLPAEWIPRIREKYFFYTWDEAEHVVRWMTSFDTTEKDVTDFVEFVRTIAAG